MKWMEDYTRNFNARRDWDQSTSDWNTHDITLVKPDATTYTGNALAFKVSKAMYESFTKEYHEPYFLICWETSNGWEMIGQAYLFANCQGNPGPGEKKVKDSQGREWDVKTPGGFHLQYVKKEGAAHGGIELQRVEIMSDSLPAMQILLQRGVLKM